MPGRTWDPGDDPPTDLELQWRAGRLPGRTLLTWFVQAPKWVLQWRAGRLPGRTGAIQGHQRSAGTASMEGRAIARPDRCTTCGHRRGNLLQWRAGRLPGRTVRDDDRSESRGCASMEGRAIARPDSTGGGRPFNAAALQWRAGRLPGRTRRSSTGMARHAPASMEGRAIARPDRPLAFEAIAALRVLQWRAGRLPGFNGASMEGRAIARPDSPRRGWSGTAGWCFNGGPGDCPAGPHCPHDSTYWGPTEWRAGRLPGRTSGPWYERQITASMEGRAIARPDIVDDLLARSSRLASMEGRAIARPDLHAAPPTSCAVLQWRAGRLPGRTSSCPIVSPRRFECNVGRAIAGHGLPWIWESASMEGRAIARPDQGRAIGGGPAIARPDGTPITDDLLGALVAAFRFNGGPGDCPAGPS